MGLISMLCGVIALPPGAALLRITRISCSGCPNTAVLSASIDSVAIDALAVAVCALAGTADNTGFDWSLGGSVGFKGLELGVAYVGVEGPSIDGFTDDTIVATLSASF